MALWDCEDIGIWTQHVEALPERRKGLKKPFLADLDRWFYDELPTAIAERDPPCITSEELVDLIDYKLKRGQWRPRLLNYAKEQAAAAVCEASQRAFAEVASQPGESTTLDKLTAAMTTLTALKGIGPASASLVLTAWSSEVPFMSDEALAACGLDLKDYSMPAYLRLAGKMREKAEQLSQQGHNMSVKDVEMALWSERIAGQPKGASKKSTKRKR